MQDMVIAMFAEFWPVRDVKRMIAVHYGERLSTNSLRRYRRRHWQERRDLAQATFAALEADREAGVMNAEF
jgi:hypothetical protein